MPYARALVCVSCGATHSTRVPYTCPACGGILDIQYDYRAIAGRITRRTLAARRGHSQWRYRELLPIGDDATLPGVPVGWTPIADSAALARHVGVKALYLKDDGRNPSGSLKDRASALGVVKAREKRRKIIACASTGNAASSLAGMAASMALKSVIFVPERTPEPKLTQLLVFGATVLRVRGAYDDAYRLCRHACGQWGWYNRNCAINPYLMEGKKTAGLEICEQLDWSVPDWVSVSVGDGCTIAGIWKGFREMHTLGLIERTPKMLGVQAAPNTIADSIAVGEPRNWKKATLAVAESGGAMIDVSDDEILDAMRYTGRLAGIFAEPAAAASVAGIRRAGSEGIVSRRASVLAMITGSGLKDIRSARAAVGDPFDLPRDGSGLEAILREQKLVAIGWHRL
jgi:threonine synthase